jgi:CBS domain-containing protein
MLPASANVREALQAMSAHRIGSVLLHDDRGALVGIFTRHDVLDRVALAHVELEQPVSTVMTHPVVTLPVDATAFDAMRLMIQRHIRHVPVLAQGRVVNLVSERDLFALQRLSVKHLASTIERCQSLPDFQRAAADIRVYARHLLAQGVQARQLTALISYLNDQLTAGLVRLELSRAGLDEASMCWVAVGSEGRAEQTLATDQDNALVFASDDPQAERPRWLAFARAVNEALDACGYPLCRGGVMAGNPPCCLTAAEWEEQFARWIDAGGPKELLHAAVFFDLRAVLGRSDWLEALREQVLARTRATPRFVRQMVQAHLEHPVALMWHGGIRAQREGEHRWFDLKLQGTALLVEGARILALAQGVAATGTRERLQQAGRAAGVPDAEVDGWVAAFDVLQTLRLTRQLDSTDTTHPNRIDLNRLNTVDHQMLKAAQQAIRTLQQRLQLDYLR